MKRVRLDRLLVQRGLAQSRERARDAIEAGEVTVGGIVVKKVASQVATDAAVALVAEPMRFVSRGGLKLEQALDAFDVPVSDAVAMDVGASTGGFTDCLLQRGAARVYAIDVGYGQLAWKLRQDARVVVHERTNVRALSPEHVPELVDLIVVDCSFIGLTKVVRPAQRWSRAGGHLVALVKPQFEVGRGGLRRGGVVRDAATRHDAIKRVEDELSALGWTLQGGVDCETHGPAGNVEYLLHATREEQGDALSGSASP